MIFSEWPSKVNRRLTPAQVRMIRDGWVKAKSQGWTLKEWGQDVGALLGISAFYAGQIVQRSAYKDVE